MAKGHCRRAQVPSMTTALPLEGGDAEPPEDQGQTPTEYGRGLRGEGDRVLQSRKKG